MLHQISAGRETTMEKGNRGGEEHRASQKNEVIDENFDLKSTILPKIGDKQSFIEKVSTRPLKNILNANPASIDQNMNKTTTTGDNSNSISTKIAPFIINGSQSDNKAAALTLHNNTDDLSFLTVEKLSVTDEISYLKKIISEQSATIDLQAQEIAALKCQMKDYQDLAEKGAYFADMYEIIRDATDLSDLK